MNLYATPQEIKQAMPDGIRSTTTAYDDLIYKLSQRLSRMVDKWTGRMFYPYSGTRYYDGDGSTEQWIDDCVSITTLSYSKDDGVNYTDYTSNDYYATVGENFNRMNSYNTLVANVSTSAAISYFPAGQRSIKLAGVFGYTDDRDTCWEDIQDDVESNPLAADGTSMTVNDADGADKWGFAPRFQIGQILRIESEFCEVVGVNETTNSISLVRGVNGTTAAAHVQNTDIYVWRTPGPVKQAVVIQAVKQMERGFQGFGDARAQPDIGQLFYLAKLDPEAEMLLDGYRVFWW